jgi:hypothetical protein
MHVKNYSLFKYQWCSVLLRSTCIVFSLSVRMRVTRTIEKTYWISGFLIPLLFYCREAFNSLMEGVQVAVPTHAICNVYTVILIIHNFDSRSKLQFILIHNFNIRPPRRNKTFTNLSCPTLRSLRNNDFNTTIKQLFQQKIFPTGDY